MSYAVFAAGNLTTHVLLDRDQPGTSNVLPPLVDQDITGAGFAEVVPPGATAVAMTLVTETEGLGGYVSAYPVGIAWPGASSITWFGPGQPAHVVVDETGYLVA